MKINSAANLSFFGLKNDKNRSMFVFDLDGTLASANQKQLMDIFQKAKKCNSEIVYATGRSKESYENLKKEKLFQEGTILFNPDYLITDNGCFLYEKIGDKMVENEEYSEVLRIDKSDGVKFLKKRNNIEYSEILMAGNGANDISLAFLTKSGAKFICVKNSSAPLKDFCKKHINSNIFLSKTTGAEGIKEGINFFA